MSQQPEVLMVLQNTTLNVRYVVCTADVLFARELLETEGKGLRIFLRPAGEMWLDVSTPFMEFVRLLSGASPEGGA